jgi:hypothetical protein
MNNVLDTTGQIPLAIGSVELFQVQPWLLGLPWAVTSGSLKLTDPNGMTTTFTLSVVGGTYTAGPWTVAGPAGQWARTWTLSDASGAHQVSLQIPFQVVQS